MNVFKKYYTCDAVEKGQLVGSLVWSFWFWQSPVNAHKKLCKELTEVNPKADIINFRRIK